MRKIWMTLSFFLVFSGYSLFSPLLFPFALSSTQAASPTVQPKTSPSPTPSSSLQPSPSAKQTTENLKERIDRVIEETRGKVQGTTDRVGVKQRGFIGEVQRVTEKTLTLRNRKGNETLTLDSGLIIVKNNGKATVDDIAVGDWLIVMGYLENETFEPKRIIISSTPLTPARFETGIGNLKESTRTQLTFLGLDRQEIKYILNTTTQFQDSEGNVIKREALGSETQILVISREQDANKIATVVRSMAPIQGNNE